MKRVRKIYVTEHYGRVDSDSPKLRGIGLYGAADYFGNIAARQLYGSQAVVLEIEQGDYHRLKPSKRGRGAPARAKLDITGFVDQYILIGFPVGCGIIETDVIVVPIRITRARRGREYFEQPAFQPPPKRSRVEPAPFRKRG